MAAGAFNCGDREGRMDHGSADDNLPGSRAISGANRGRGLDFSGGIGLRCLLPSVGIAAVVGIGGTHSIDHRTEHGNPSAVELSPGSLNLG